MKPRESELPDRPFPGAHSQVPGPRREAAGVSTSETAPPRLLPLEANRERSEQGWVVRLPVRAEHVTVAKQVVISERVVLRRDVVDDVTRIEAVVQREQVRLETEGQVEIVGSAADQHDEVRQQPGQIAARQGLPWRNDSNGPVAS